MREALVLLSGVGGAIVGYLYGGWSPVLDFLLFAVLIDYFTGLSASFKEGKLSSKVGFLGIIKKVVIFLIVALASKADHVTGMGSTLQMSAAIGYIVNEVLSISENAGRLGVNFPDALKNAIASLKGQNGPPPDPAKLSEQLKQKGDGAP